MDDIQAVVADLVSKGETEAVRSVRLRSLLMRACKHLWNMELCGTCKKELKQAYRKIVNWHTQNNGKIMSGIFKLRPGSSYPLRFGSSIRLNAATLTDDLALEFLRINPNNIKVFVDYPSDWKVRIGIEPAAEKAEEVVKPKKQKAEIKTAVMPTVNKIIIE